MTREDWERIKADLESLRPSWKTGAVFASDLALISLSLYFTQVGGLLPHLLSICLLAVALLHFYLLLHEATHSAISENKRINDAVGHFCGWFILMPFLPRQTSHLLHHIWTGHPVGDPANQRIIRRFSVMTRKQADRLEGIWSSWLPLLTLNDRIGMWRAPFQQKRKGAKSARYSREIRSLKAYAIGYLALFIGVTHYWSLSGFLEWYLPALLIQLALEELANLPHHAETPLLNENEKALPYWEQHRVTHSCRSVPIWSRFVLLNFNLHTAHHFYPWVPWYGLRFAHEEICKKMPELREDQQTRNELAWSLVNRRRPLLEIMGHYFDKIAPRTDTMSPATEPSNQ